MIRRIPEITAEQEHFRLEPVFTDLGTAGVVTARRDPVEPVPVGTYVAMVFRVTGYDPDCDGSLMARLACVSRDGAATGWTENCIGLHPGCMWVVDGPGELDQMAGGTA
jgi:hypothetical protein